MLEKLSLTAHLSRQRLCFCSRMFFLSLLTTLRCADLLCAFLRVTFLSVVVGCCFSRTHKREGSGIAMDPSLGDKNVSVWRSKGGDSEKKKKKETKKPHWLVAKEHGKRKNGSEKRKSRKVEDAGVDKPAAAPSAAKKPKTREEALELIRLSPEEQRDYLWAGLRKAVEGVMEGLKARASRSLSQFFFFCLVSSHTSRKFFCCRCWCFFRRARACGLWRQGVERRRCAERKGSQDVSSAGAVVRRREMCGADRTTAAADR
jgi:hypothetical protein